MACAVEGDEYVAHCGAMLYSLLAHHRNSDVHIVYLHGDDASGRRLLKLGEMVRRLGGEIDFLEVARKRLAGLPTKGFTRTATWYRIFLPELLDHHERVLYLDADLLVLESLRELWETDLSNHLLGAVSNVVQRHDFDRASNKFALPRKEAYFNAGVMLMNLELMRREQVTTALYDYAVANAAELGWRDQDALNVILHSRRLALHPRWNAMNSVLTFPWAVDYFGEQAVLEARRRPAIRHFEGPTQNKPWHLLADPTLRRMYAEHRRHTPWPRVRPAGITPANLWRYALQRS